MRLGNSGVKGMVRKLNEYSKKDLTNTYNKYYNKELNQKLKFVMGIVDAFEDTIGGRDISKVYEDKDSFEWLRNLTDVLSTTADKINGILDDIEEKGENGYFAKVEESIRKVNGRKRVNEGHTEDGYMGATKWVGDKSHLSLYGKDLSSAIRQDLKDNGITGCTVSTKHGDSVTVTVKGKGSDKIPYSQWRKNNFETDVMDWFNQYGYAPIGNGNYVTYKDYLEYTDAEIEDFARQYYDVNIGNEKEFQINHYYIERNYSDTFTRQFIDKLKKINDILVEFVYDDSNAQVDYFARNIYYHIVVVFQ